MACVPWAVPVYLSNGRNIAISLAKKKATPGTVKHYERLCEYVLAHYCANACICIVPNSYYSANMWLVLKRSTLVKCELGQTLLPALCTWTFPIHWRFHVSVAFSFVRRDHERTVHQLGYSDWDAYCGALLGTESKHLHSIVFSGHRRLVQSTVFFFFFLIYLLCFYDCCCFCRCLFNFHNYKKKQKQNHKGMEWVDLLLGTSHEIRASILQQNY